MNEMQEGTFQDIAKYKIEQAQDDLIDTLLLSLFYEGRLSTFAPKSYLDKMDLTLIRPLIMTKEIDVYGYSKTLPVIKSCCPANKMTKREYVKDIIKNIQKDIPNVRDMIFTALIHPERYNLFDRFEKEINLI